ncbi:MAG: hypothetical protein ACRD0U_00915, partial [Acidimicrobiales bacterium]
GLAAFDDAGTPLWTRPAATPCFTFETFAADWTVACSGTLSGELETTSFVVDHIEGIAPDNGQTIWTVDGVSFDEFADAPPVLRIDERTFLLDRAGTPTLLDMVSGPPAPSGGEPSGWCSVRAPFEEWPTIDSPLFGPDTFIPAAGFYPCHRGAAPLATPPASVPAFAGITAAGYGVWVQDGRVHVAEVG